MSFSKSSAARVSHQQPSAIQPASKPAARASGAFSKSVVASSGGSAVDQYSQSFSRQPAQAAYIPPKAFSVEQMDIIHCNATVVAGQAFAGTGKSTTGIGYAMHNPNKRILVLCFNRANALEAAHKYPAVSKNVDVATTHALARRCLTSKQDARVATRWSSVTLRSELPLVGGRGDMRTAAITCNILKEFFMSTDARVDPFLHGRAARIENRASDAAIEQCCEFAQRIWLAMNTDQVLPGMRGGVNPISIPHDAYLKMFVMRGGNLGYETVIFDEAQDANPIMLKLLENQYTTGSRVLMLGDRHQAIYAFRGAVNAMEQLPEGARVLPLTQSWRFGPRTAQIANMLLGELKGEKLKIQGMGEDGRHDRDRHAMTYLSRTNADLLQRAAALDGVGVHWVGGIDGYRVTVLNDAWALSRNRINDVRDFHIKKNFQNWHEFEAAAEYDGETKILVNLVESYGAEIPQLVEALQRNAVREQQDADVTLSTLHKSKGLEWDYVKVTDDFIGAPLKTAEKWLAGNDVTFPEEEINLLYVGYTRAKLEAHTNREFREWREALPVHRSERTRSFTKAGSGAEQDEQPDSAAPTAPSPFARVAAFRPR